MSAHLASQGCGSLRACPHTCTESGLQPLVLMVCCAGQCWEAPGWSRGRRQGWEENLGFVRVSVGKAGQGKQLRVGQPDQFQQPLCFWKVPGCLAPGPRTIKTEEYCLLGCTGQIKVMHITGMLQLGLLLSLQKWLVLSSAKSLDFFKDVKTL